MKKKISEMTYQEQGVVTDIEGDLREKLAGMGIRRGKKVKMITKQPVRGPVVVSVDGADTSLGLGIAAKITVEINETTI
ncbi:MAG: ferrous iron transport protein A [Candidatus Omnitrophica bacterium]|nr:ferrous iron transport protein A [Candidatus Omnitrophota bacterium]